MYSYIPPPFIFLRDYTFLFTLCLRCVDSVFLCVLVKKSALYFFRVVTYTLKKNAFDHVFQIHGVKP